MELLDSSEDSVNLLGGAVGGRSDLFDGCIQKALESMLPIISSAMALSRLLGKI